MTVIMGVVATCDYCKKTTGLAIKTLGAGKDHLARAGWEIPYSFRVGLSYCPPCRNKIAKQRVEDQA